MHIIELNLTLSLTFRDVEKSGLKLVIAKQELFFVVEAAMAIIFAFADLLLERDDTAVQIA